MRVSIQLLAAIQINQLIDWLMYGISTSNILVCAYRRWTDVTLSRNNYEHSYCFTCVCQWLLARCCWLQFMKQVFQSELSLRNHLLFTTVLYSPVWASPGGLARPLESSGLAESWKRLIRVQFVFQTVYWWQRHNIFIQAVPNVHNSFIEEVTSEIC